MSLRRLQIENVGPIQKADIEFGDLTVLVGPQATGKSVLLQLLKLIVDTPAVQAEMRRFNIDWRGSWTDFFELYFGEGMSSIWREGSSVQVDGVGHQPESFSGSMKNRSKGEALFYIPAQRVMSLRDGLTRPFTDYRYGDPFVLREFSEKLHQLVQNEFGREAALFPREKRLNATLRKPISEQIFGGFSLQTDNTKLQKQIVLMSPEGQKPLPYLVWSAGQREFVPMLLGLYWLMPAGRTLRREPLKWVVIEEPEMGLHPDGISVVMTLVLELLSRGYRVTLSTHSQTVVEIIWGLRFLQQNKGTEADVRYMFRLPSTPATKHMSNSVLEKSMRVYFFDRHQPVLDISSLDPASENPSVAGWGRLTGFANLVGEVVSDVANRKAPVIDP